MHSDHSDHDEPKRFWGSRYAIGFLVFGGVAAYFLLTEHLAHVVGALPFLLLAACPLMHMFMHGGHGGHGGNGGHQHGAGHDSSGSVKPIQPKSGDPS